MTSSVFFRIDDLGWHHDKFMRVLELFRKHNLKLNAEAIPLSCLENNHLMKLENYGDHLEVHCHGFSHLDHQNAGKKAEFGSQRTANAVRKDLLRAQEILQEIFGKIYVPLFTPPWNRIEKSFFALLAETGFRGISLDGDKGQDQTALPALNVQVDLHTRKNAERLSLSQIQAEISKLEGQETVGIMLHHKPMTEQDFQDLDVLLGWMAKDQIKTSFMSELL